MRTLKMLTGILLAVITINAFGGGIYGMLGARDVPLQWLKGSPFSSYFIPSAFLFLAIGGSGLIATLLVFKDHRHAAGGVIFFGCLLASWIAIQLIILGYVSWLQPLVFVLGVVLMSLAAAMRFP